MFGSVGRERENSLIWVIVGDILKIFNADVPSIVLFYCYPRPHQAPRLSQSAETEDELVPFGRYCTL